MQSLENLNRPGVKAYWRRGILFCLVVVVSLIYHLPASWLAAQIAPALPKYLVTSMWQGTLWQGQVTLNWQTPQTRVHLGRLQWQVKPWQVLFLEGGVAVQWAPGQEAALQETIQAELTVQLFSPDRIHITALQGQMPVARMAQILAVYQPLPGAFEGMLALDIRSLDWRFADALPEAVNGQITLSNFNAMGVEIPQMTLVPKREEALLVLSMQGGDSHWHLQGSAGLNAQRYEIDAAIKADSEAAMPSWGAWLLRKTSPMEAVFSQAGRW
ncbi:MAG: type II secretion system protein N [Gammaproteobacteria bacterium]|nr:type II secretion system protein N [Gammaproteobacteria bacterium]